VQASTSSQALLSAWVGLEQTPVAGSQVPAMWHWSSAAQTFGLAPTQAPAWQVSACVQASPSSQEVPSAAVAQPGIPPPIPPPLLLLLLLLVLPLVVSPPELLVVLPLVAPPPEP
jgi:hypothetical protein